MFSALLFTITGRSRQRLTGCDMVNGKRFGEKTAVPLLVSPEQTDYTIGGLLVLRLPQFGMQVVVCHVSAIDGSESNERTLLIRGCDD
ncbi:MAG: hypothetical protein VX438_08510 [Planctomycetota bacterium]|nr:hypothetical protein [Planctomycetota bacterium]